MGGDIDPPTSSGIPTRAKLEGDAGAGEAPRLATSVTRPKNGSRRFIVVLLSIAHPEPQPVPDGTSGAPA
jgi:hypothetical protein